METLLPAVKLMTYIGIGLVAIGILAIRGIFRGSRSKFNYFLGSLICFALGIFFLTMKSSGSIKVTEDRLTLKVMLTKTQVIETDKIKRAWVENLQDTDWRPISRSSGASLGKLRTGWFRLQNGQRAFLALQGERALFIEAENDRVFLIGVEDFETFIRQVKYNSSRLRKLLQ
ncbi:MAG: hypothetical protein JSV17_06540 [Candidatus Aminicenantes bacterium]|nr:MAG: hypothetical protein JSV17_06540 [Candidatus Aminicenantes bacterium]